MKEEQEVKPGGWTNYKENKVKPVFPVSLESFAFEQRFGDTTGPGPGGAVSSPQMVTPAGLELDIARGYATGASFQNPWRGMRGMAPRGSASNVSYAFMRGPTGSTVQEDPTTGYYSPATGESTIVSSGAENLHNKSTETVINDAGIATMDFRVETDNKTHGVFVDASVDAVGINSAAPSQGTFDIEHGVKFGISTPTQITSNQNNYAFTGGVIDLWHQRLSSDASRNITGFDPTVLFGREYELTNVGSFNIVLQNANVGSNAAAQILTGTGLDITLAPAESVKMYYDSTSQKWRLSAKVYAAGAGGNHNLLDGSVHPDTVVQTPTKGSLICGNSTPAWDELPVGTDNFVLIASSGATNGLKWGSQGHTLLDGSTHTDTVAQTPGLGSLVVGTKTSNWDELVVGTNTHILTADSGAANGIKWAAPVLQTSALLDGSAHTDTVAQTVSRGSLIYGNTTPAWDELVVGSSTFPRKILTADGTDAAWTRNQGDVVHVPTTADTPVNSVTDVTIVTKDVTDVSAGDQVIVDAWFVILNNSGATRVYVITADFDGAFDVEHSTAALATSATLMHTFRVQAVCDIRSTSLAYGMMFTDGELAAGRASGDDSTMAATMLSARGWGTTASNLTGTLTVALKIRSANATATQTCRLHSFNIRKLTPF